MSKVNSSGVPAMVRDWSIRVVIALLACIITALVGPYTTYERLSLVERFLYWSGMIAGLLLPAVFVRSLVLRVINKSALKNDLIAALVLGVIFGLSVWVINTYIMQFDGPTLQSLIEHVAIVTLICTVPAVLRHYIRIISQTGRKPISAHDRDISQNYSKELIYFEDCALLNRLEPRKKGRLMRISADGHTLVVYTDKGVSRIRMRFADALEQLQSAPGMQVHRSHWLAYDTIRSIVQDGRRYEAELQCGAVVPVSQSHLPELEAAGFRSTYRDMGT